MRWKLPSYGPRQENDARAPRARVGADNRADGVLHDFGRGGVRAQSLFQHRRQFVAIAVRDSNAEVLARCGRRGHLEVRGDSVERRIDIAFLSEGTPFSELVISDPDEQHVALLQRYKAHWLIQCGTCYGTADVAVELSDAQGMQLALFALAHEDAGPSLVSALEVELARRASAGSRSRLPQRRVTSAWARSWPKRGCAARR